MMRRTNPCKRDCPKRKVGCHGVCQDYLEYNEYLKIRRRERYIQNELNQDTYQAKKYLKELCKKLNH